MGLLGIPMYSMAKAKYICLTTKYLFNTKIYMFNNAGNIV